MECNIPQQSRSRRTDSLCLPVEQSEADMPDEYHGRDGAAVVMRQYGEPAVLVVESVPLPALLSDEIRVRSIASAVNHSDLEIRAGNWHIRRAEPFPYTPGLEVVGEIVEAGSAVTEFREGDRDHDDAGSGGCAIGTARGL